MIVSKERVHVSEYSCGKSSKSGIKFYFYDHYRVVFFVSILTLSKPTNFTCKLGMCLRSTVPVTIIVILILKTMKILSAFRINVIAERLKKFILAAKRQTWIVLTLIFPQVLFVLLWITLDPPRQERTIQPVERTIALSCSLYQSPVGRTFQMAFIFTYRFLPSFAHFMPSKRELYQRTLTKLVILYFQCIFCCFLVWVISQFILV